MTPERLDQVGLVLGLISGLLLIPEVFNLIPVERLQAALEARLRRLAVWTQFPLRYGPPSWKVIYTSEERAALEPTSAIRSLLFSLVWITLLLLGIRLYMDALVVLVVVILVAVTLGNVLRHKARLPRLGAIKVILLFATLIFMLAAVTPLVSLLRVVLLLLRALAIKFQGAASRHGTMRRLLTVLAVAAFIVSNVLQLVATLNIFPVP